VAGSVSGLDHTLSPWGDPAPASEWYDEPVPPRFEPVALAAAGDLGEPAEGAADPGAAKGAARPPTTSGTPGPPGPPRSPTGPQAPLKRSGQLVERTVTVRILPKTSTLRRIRAFLALAVIATCIGFLVAGAFGLAVWGIATAIHHAANN
jgi:hypothetical protein